MNTRTMTTEDVERIQVDPNYRSALLRYIEASPDTTRIGEIDGQPIFACGINIFWPGVAEAWVQVFDESHAIGIIRAIQKILKDQIADYNLHRLQATVRSDDARTLRFDTFLGFEVEATLKEFYTNKTDAIILRYNYGT